MTAVHIVSAYVYPWPGGMEAAVLRVAQSLAALPDFEVTIYSRRQLPEGPEPHPAHQGIEVEYLGAQKALLLQPLGELSTPFSESDPSSYLAENFRADYILLRAGIERRLRADPSRRHVIVSFFATSSGFIAQHVALSLDLPHVAALRGSDFSRDFRNPTSLHALRFVAEQARVIVTVNQEQARTLAAAFPFSRELRTIHNSSSVPLGDPLWTAPPSPAVRLICDSGFSTKKATHLLLEAAAQLAESGRDISLTVVGADMAREQSYWSECRERYSARCRGVFSFPGLVSAQEVEGLLRASHIYCSATLGEGCSNSRVRALTLGIPILTTRCGALPDVAADCAHVRLCPPGDLAALRCGLDGMIRDTLSGTLATDPERIGQWRRLFSRAREQEQWQEAVEAACAERSSRGR